MAFRKHDPNVLRPPDVETDKTWIVSKSTTNNRSKRNDTDDLDIGAILNEFNDGGKSTIPVGNKTTCSARPLGINNTSFSVHNDNQFEIIPKPDGPNVPTKQRTLAIELGKEHRRKRNTLAQQFYSQEPKPVVQEPPVLVRKSGNLKLNVIGTKRGATIQSSLQHTVHGSNVVLLGRSSKPSTKSSLQREAKLTSLDYKRAATTLPSPVPKKVPFPFYHDSLPDEPTKFNDDQPSLEDYKREIRSLTDSGKSEAVFKAEIILRSMIVEHKATKTGSQPDAVCFNSIIYALANLGEAQKAGELMYLMFEQFASGNKTAVPNVRSLTNVLHAFRIAKLAPERLEDLLFSMFDLSVKDPTLEGCKPDMISVTVLLQCWSETEREDAVEKSLSLFRRAKNLFLGGDESMRPDCISYSLVMNVLAKSNDWSKAESLFWEMVHDFIDGNEAAKPRTRNLNTIIAMYSRSNSSSAPEKAEQCVHRFRELVCKHAGLCKPDHYTYSLLLKTWTVSKRDDYLDQAASCFYWLRDLGDTGDDAAKLDKVKYSTIINAFARGDQTNQAEQFLNMMITDPCVEAEYQVFDVLALSFSRNQQLGRAEALFKLMWKLAETQPALRPKKTLYQRIIIAYAQHRCPNRADKLLWEMEKHDMTAKRNVWQCVMNAWHSSNDKRKHKKISALRVGMEERFG